MGFQVSSCGQELRVSYVKREFCVVFLASFSLSCSSLVSLFILFSFTALRPRAYAMLSFIQVGGRLLVISAKERSLFLIT